MNNIFNPKTDFRPGHLIRFLSKHSNSHTYAYLDSSGGVQFKHYQVEAPGVAMFLRYLPKAESAIYYGSEEGVLTVEEFLVEGGKLSHHCFEEIHLNSYIELLEIPK